MGKKRAYEIAFVGLKSGIHEFNFELDAQFFAEKEAQDFLHPKADVKMTLEKNTGFIMLHFEVGGNAASALQFFATDSVHHFLRGALYFNVTPNADSLKPANQFLRADVEHLIKTLKWTK